MAADGTQWLADWLQRRRFELDGASADGIGHRFVRKADPGPGRVAFDVLATEGLGARATVLTVPPLRTVQAPGSAQALAGSEVVDRPRRLVSPSWLPGPIRHEIGRTPLCC
jgi:hypothetical protein